MANENLVCECLIEQILKSGFTARSFAEKQEIIESGRPMAQLKKLCTVVKNFTRHFSIELYDKHTWLSGCDFLNKVYCWPCLLFAKDKGVWRTNGFSDLNNIYKAIKRHENSEEHFKAVLDIKRFGKVRIETALSEAYSNKVNKHNALVKENMQIMECLIDVACYLGEQELPFRGHDESQDSANKGKYIELVYVIAKYYPQLKTQIEKSNVFTGLSNDIQNDLISSVSAVIISQIKFEIKHYVKFVSIILDECSDVSNKSQLSIILRYVDRFGEIQERFLGFCNVSADRSASGLFDVVKNILNEFDCVEKLVAQSYDGAAVMAGHLTGLQSRVKILCKEAIFIHCYAHRLNLVLSQSISQNKDCKIFFMTLTGISTFFKKSSKRTSALDFLIKKRIPAAAPTRWQYNARIVNVVFEHKKDLTELFTNMLNNPSDWDAETINCARGYLNTMQDFKFNFLLTVFSELFPFSDILFECLQKRNSDINLCNKKISEYNEIVNEKRNEFEIFWQKTNAVIPYEANIPSSRTTREKTDIDAPKIIYRKLFYEIIDNISMQLKCRFENIKELEFLELLNFNFFIKYRTTFPENSYNKLQLAYGKFFDFPKLRTELNVIYSDVDFAGKSVLEINYYLRDNDLMSTFSEITKLSQLFLTIPVTSASAERSFSGLRRIKTYLRSTINDQKLSSLALLSVEKKLLKQLKQIPNFYDLVIIEFKKKNRRIELNYM